MQGFFEKEEFIKKYCIVTGQKYEAAVRESSNDQGREGGGVESDGSYFSFEKLVKEMGVKQLRKLIKERNGNLRGLVEKSELINAALELYEGTSKLGRTMFGRDAAAEEEKEKGDARAAAPPSPPKKGGQPNISTEKMREYERKMRGRGSSVSSPSKRSGGGGCGGQKTPPPTKKDDGVTLESVVKEYNNRMGRTAFGRAAFEDDEEEEEEEEKEEKEEDKKGVWSQVSSGDELEPNDVFVVATLQRRRAKLGARAEQGVCSSDIP